MFHETYFNSGNIFNICAVENIKLVPELQSVAPIEQPPEP